MIAPELKAAAFGPFQSPKAILQINLYFQILILAFDDCSSSMKTAGTVKGLDPLLHDGRDGIAAVA
jgi:hypothetical protein